MSSEFGERLEMARDAFNDLLQERDTLIACLRECVVALGELAKPLGHTGMGSDEIVSIIQHRDNTYRQALTHAKSTLERYKGDK